MVAGYRKLLQLRERSKLESVAVRAAPSLSDPRWKTRRRIYVVDDASGVRAYSPGINHPTMIEGPPSCVTGNTFLLQFSSCRLDGPASKHQ